MSEDFDVIIVGAGSAGCVLAERLSALGSQRVLVLEAGGDPNSLFVRMPLGFPRVFKTARDWAFETEPQAAVHGRKVFTPRGRMLGGSSNLNAMMHQWCHPADFDGWAASGAAGWDWPSVRPVFAAMECLDGAELADRGHSGPMRVGPNRHAHALTHAWVASARACGLGDQTSYNGHAFEGAWIAELAVDQGRRFSLYDAYLKPAMRRPNLKVQARAQVLRLILEGRRVVGVRYRLGDQEYAAKAGQVVLSAGAFGSPQILMLSGIGPADHLQTLGIPVRVPAAGVGSDLQDHPVLPLNWRCRSSDTLKRAGAPWRLLQWLLQKRGMLASNGVEGLAFTRALAQPGEAPDIEIMFMPLEFRDQFLEPPRVHGFAMGAAVAKPRSRGRVRLNSTDPLEAPSIDPALLSDPDGHDAAALWAAVATARRIAAMPPLADWNAGETAPGPEIQTPDQLRRYAGQTLQTVYHPTSTCRMGLDERAVVDPQLRFRGVDGLWVVDASVMPSVPRGHPNAVVAMLAHRAADWIQASLH